MSYKRALRSEEVFEMTGERPFNDMDSQEKSELVKSVSKSVNMSTQQTSRVMSNINYDLNKFFKFVNVLNNYHYGYVPEDGVDELLEKHDTENFTFSNQNHWFLDNQTRRVLWVKFQWEFRNRKNKDGRTAKLAEHNGWDYVTESHFWNFTWFKFVEECKEELYSHPLVDEELLDHVLRKGFPVKRS